MFTLKTISKSNTYRQKSNYVDFISWALPHPDPQCYQSPSWGLISDSSDLQFDKCRYQKLEFFGYVIRFRYVFTFSINFKDKYVHNNFERGRFVEKITRICILLKMEKVLWLLKLRTKWNRLGMKLRSWAFAPS